MRRALIFIALLAAATVQAGSNQTITAGTLTENNADGSTITIINTGTWYPWITAVAGPLTGGMTVDVADAAGDHLIVPVAGTYLVNINGSYNAGNTDATQFRIYAGGAGSTVVCWRRTMGAAAAVGSAGANGLITLTAGQEIRLEATSDTNGDAIVVYNVNMSATRVGP